MSTVTKRWVCTVCGYVHEGPEPPEACPVCGAGPDMFEAEEEPKTSAPAAPDTTALSQHRRQHTGI
ncbi:MAG TPA: hypothetical protein PLD73_01335, partial [Candidatus Hydrogenedentes bacterium]|nr:hypothetical protein [Candidatus Hydrogenedentota bacterium]